MEAPTATLGACPMHFQWLSHNYPDLKTAEARVSFDPTFQAVT